MTETTEGLAGRAIIVTGAAGGIGAAAARAVAAKGARLLLVDLSEEKLGALAEEINAGPGEAKVCAADCTSEDDMARMAETCVEAYGGIDALIAAAGILRAGEGMKTLATMPFADFKKVIDVNLTGTFLANRAVLGPMLAAKRGDIVNISSVSGKQGRAFDSAYSASKFAIIGLSESLAEEVQREGVRVQTLLPDAVDTGLWDQSGTAALKPRAMLTPDNVGAFITYLLELPRDAYLVNPVVAPIPQRRKRGKG
ncbi:SDR family oxidoreductase [Pseudoroseicyclus sp. H15]